MEIENDGVNIIGAFGAVSKSVRDNKDYSPNGVLPVDLNQNVADGMTDSGFWKSVAADEIALNWNLHFPYAFYIVENRNGTYSKDAVVASFVLPMPPQQLTIDAPAAINVAVTMGGVHSEHNGAPLRNISISGTTGVLPLKGDSGSLASLSAPEAIFAGTIGAAVRLGQTATQAAQVLLQGYESRETPNINTVESFGAINVASELGRSTGFYQFHLLQRFLESYYALKKSAEGRKYRLAFCIWKDKESYLVEPRNFFRQRSAQSPLEYRYTLNMVAWRRFLWEEGTNLGGSFTSHLASRNPNLLARIATVIFKAREILSGAKAVLRGVRGDIGTLFNIMRELQLGISEAAGLDTYLSEYGQDVLKDCKEAMAEMFGTKKKNDRDFGAPGRELARNLRNLAVEADKARSLGGRTSGSSMSGGSNGGVYRGPLGGPANANPAIKALESPEENFEFFSKISPNDLNLRPEVIRKMNEARRRAALLTRYDYENARNLLAQICADFAQSIGVGDATYNTAHGTGNVSQIKEEPTEEDWEILTALQDSIQALDFITVDTNTIRSQPDPMEYVAGLASGSGIAFTVPRSKYSVPFPYGSSMEQVARQYLGDPDRWMEIAALNGLRSPYVDEVGWQKLLLVNGAENEVLVESSENLFTGQVVWIGSRTVKREKRRITAITNRGGSIVVTLNGDSDLQKFSTIAGAYLQGFLPDTVNSQQQIFIPSDSEADDSFRTRQIPGIDYFDPMVRAGGISLLLDSDGDLVRGPDGATRLAVGLVNAVQRVKLFFSTPRGSILRHPTYGNPLQVGTSVADLSAKDVLDAARGFFSNDKTFSGISGAAVSINGNVARVRLNVGIRITGTYIPIEVQLPRV